VAADGNLSAAIDALAQYRDEGIVLQAAVDLLRERPAAIDRILSRMDAASPNGAAAGFLALREDMAHTRVQLDVAIDFLDKAVEELGGTPPYDQKARELHVLAEEAP
jgi:hypothetical protein